MDRRLGDLGVAAVLFRTRRDPLLFSSVGLPVAVGVVVVVGVTAAPKVQAKGPCSGRGEENGAEAGSPRS